MQSELIWINALLFSAPKVSTQAIMSFRDVILTA